MRVKTGRFDDDGKARWIKGLAKSLTPQMPSEPVCKQDGWRHDFKATYGQSLGSGGRGGSEQHWLGMKSFVCEGDVRVK